MEFEIGTYVEIQEGFYKDCMGVVRGCQWDEDAQQEVYTVSVEGSKSLDQFREAELEEVPEPTVTREEFEDIMAECLGGPEVAEQFSWW